MPGRRRDERGSATAGQAGDASSASKTTAAVTDSAATPARAVPARALGRLPGDPATSASSAASGRARASSHAVTREGIALVPLGSTPTRPNVAR